MSKGYKGKFVVESTFSHKEEDVTLILALLGNGKKAVFVANWRLTIHS